MVDKSLLIREQQADLLYEQSPFVNGVIIVVATLLTWFFMERVDHVVLMTWTMAIILVALLRISLWYWRTKRLHQTKAYNWIKRHVLLTGVMGIVWGSASIFYFLVDDAQVNTLLYVLVCGITTAGVPVLAAWFPAYLAYTLPQVSMLVSVTFYQAYYQPETQALSYFLIFTLLIYYTLLISLARRSHNHIQSELELKENNNKLVDKLNNEVLLREQLIDARTHELKKANKTLEESQDHLLTLSSAVEASPNGILITAANGKIQYMNPKAELITGYNNEEVVGRSAKIFRSKRHKGEVFSDIWYSVKAGKDWLGEIENRRKNGEKYWIKEYVAPIHNEDNVITHFVAILEDITEARELADQLSYQATHDSLTGLINRTEFERRLDELVGKAKKTDSVHALCFVDLDQFKVINDTCGHIAGDELLRQLSDMLIRKIRKSDTLARLGGDEFAILMADCNQNQAKKVAQEICEHIEQFQFVWETRVFTIGASIGVTKIHSLSVDSTEVLKQADTACYAAKNAGRNRVYIFENDDKQLVAQQGEFLWVNEIRRALSEDRFELYAQPIFDTRDSYPAAFEVLLRLRHENGESASPGAFLPSAERYNLSDKIDRWVIEKTFNWLDKHVDDIPHLKQMAINLSGASLGKQEMLAYLIDKLKEAKFPASTIQFEITETAAVSNLSDARHVIQVLSELGCKFSLDDFGTGLSSFGYLKNLPVQSIKIDGVFVKDMVNDPLDFEMVKAINDIGHVMGMETIAEFVEDELVWNKLRAMGVDYGQGFFLGKPEPIDHILNWRV